MVEVITFSITEGSRSPVALISITAKDFDTAKLLRDKITTLDFNGRNFNQGHLMRDTID